MIAGGGAIPEPLVADGGTLDACIALLAESGAADDARWDAERRKAFGDGKRGFAADAALFKWWMKTRLEWVDAQLSGTGTLMTSVRNGASACPYDRRPDKLALSVVQRGRRIDAVCAVSDGSTVSLDISVNGRVIRRGEAVPGGRCAVVLPKNACKPAGGGLSLVEATGRDARGAVTFRNYETFSVAEDGLAIRVE